MHVIIMINDGALACARLGTALSEPVKGSSEGVGTRICKMIDND